MRDETANATQARLLQVIGHADFEVLPGLYAFRPLAAGGKPRDDSLACVRDGAAWSELAPVGDLAAPMAFRVFAFHFDPAYDATGFVGWLHSHLARATGARGGPVQRAVEQRRARRPDRLPRPRPPGAQARRRHGPGGPGRSWRRRSGGSGRGAAPPAGNLSPDLSRRSRPCRRAP